MYPVIVYVGIKYFSLGTLALILAGLLGLRALQVRKGSSPYLKGALFFAILLAAVTNLLAAVFQNEIFMKLYPAIMTSGFLVVFILSLLRNEPMIEVIARQRNPQLPIEARPYLRTWTWIWVGFFVFNLIVSLATTFWGTREQWVIYNGTLSYLLMGMLFAAEWLYRMMILKRRGQHS